VAEFVAWVGVGVDLVFFAAWWLQELMLFSGLFPLFQEISVYALFTFVLLVHFLAILLLSYCAVVLLCYLYFFVCRVAFINFRVYWARPVCSNGLQQSSVIRNPDIRNPST